MSSTPKRTGTNNYERKLARQRQLELMEAAASGIAPAMELDTSSISALSSNSSLRSRSNDRSNYNTTTNRLQQDEEVKFTNSPVRSSKNTTGSLFDQRGRPDLMPVNTGLNLMDHETGIYHEQSKTEQFLARVRAFFGGKQETLHDGGDYLDYRRSSGKYRQSSSESFAKSLWVDKKRRYMLMLLLIAIIIVVFTTWKTSSGHIDKVLRQQNNNRFNSIMDNIIHGGVSSATTFLDYKSPEYHALRWVAYSDPARLDLNDPMLLERYSLAVFFYHSYIIFEKKAGRQKPIEVGVKQWEGVPNPGWTRKDHWLTERGICMWHGIYCAARDEADPETGSKMKYDANEPVTAIKIQNNNVLGGVPVEFKALNDLYLLDLANNQLSGSIPAHLGQLFRLEYLHLSTNSLKGSLPSEIGNMESLKTLDLQNNQLEGQLPSTLNRMYNLENLALGHNKFAGSIPRLNDLKTLKTIYLDHNALDKAFPFALAMQSSLTELHLNHNQISGSLPGEIESIKRLEKLRLEFNRMQGPVPRGVMNRLSHLREFSIDGNSFSGTFPTDLGGLRSIEILSASENKLTGTIPPLMGHLTTMQKLHFNQNDFSGKFPASLGNLTSIVELWVQGNDLTGLIPSSLGNCLKMDSLLLDDNKLSGDVPSDLGKLKALKAFRIQQNSIKGSIPYEVCALKQFHALTFLAADCVSKVRCEEGCCSECF